MCDLARTHWCMQVEDSLEVATLDVSTPLVVALDGGVTVLPTSTVVDLLPEVCHVVAGHRRARCCAGGRAPGIPGGACATDGVRTTDRKRDCRADGWCCPSWCGVLMAAMTS
jgi:hypothetical protein